MVDDRVHLGVSDCTRWVWSCDASKLLVAHRASGDRLLTGGQFDGLTDSNGSKLDGGTTALAARNLSFAFVLPVSHRSSTTLLSSCFCRLTEDRAAQLAASTRVGCQAEWHGQQK